MTDRPSSNHELAQWFISFMNSGDPCGEGPHYPTKEQGLKFATELLSAFPGFAGALASKELEEARVLASEMADNNGYGWSPEATATVARALLAATDKGDGT